MNIHDALILAKGKNGCAVLGKTKLIPCIGRMPTITGGGIFDDFNRVFEGNLCYSNIVSWEELISDEWEVYSLRSTLYGFNALVKDYVPKDEIWVE